jgi:hypothetical protein
MDTLPVRTTPDGREDGSPVSRNAASRFIRSMVRLGSNQEIRCLSVTYTSVGYGSREHVLRAIGLGRSRLVDGLKPVRCKSHWQRMPPACGLQAGRCCSFCGWPAGGADFEAGAAAFSDVPQPSSEKHVIRASILHPDSATSALLWPSWFSQKQLTSAQNQSRSAWC